MFNFFTSDAIVMDIPNKCKLFLKNEKNISCYFACVETDYFCVSKLIIYQLLLFCQVNDRMTTQKKHFLYLLFSVNYLHSHGKIKFFWECRYIWTKIS